MDRPIIVEFTKGFSMMTSLVNILCLFLQTIQITIIILQITQHTTDLCAPMIMGTVKTNCLTNKQIKDGDLPKSETAPIS